jgi:hypothetical protein
MEEPQMRQTPPPPAPVNGQQPPRTPEERKRLKKEERMRHRDKRRAGRWKRVAFSLIIILMLLVIIMLLSVLVGFDPFGIGYGKDGGGVKNIKEAVDILTGNEEDPAPTSTPVPTEPAATSTPAPAEEGEKTIVISIEGTKIYYGDIPCTDVSELKDNIINEYTINGVKKFEVSYTTAIASKYDEVKEVLDGLQETLGIEFSHTR